MAVNVAAPATLHTDYESATWTTGTTTGNMTKPTGLADTNTLLAVLYDQVAASTWPTRPSGFTEAFHTTSTGSRGCALDTKPIPTASSEPANYAFSDSNSGRGCAILIRASGGDQSTVIDAVPAAAGDFYNGSAAASGSIPGVTAANPGARPIIVCYANGTGAVTHTPSATGYTLAALAQVNNAGSTSSLGLLVANNPVAAAGAISAVTVTWTASDAATNPASQGGFMATLKSAPIAASSSMVSGSSLGAGATVGGTSAAMTSGSSLTGAAALGAQAAAGMTSGSVLTGALQTLVDRLLAQPTPFYVSHRGGEVSWPEDTAYAYAQSAAWNPEMALECAVWPTSDGFYMINDAATTGAAWDSNLTIGSSTKATLQGLRSLQDSTKGPMFLDEFLPLYAGKRVIFLDNKPQSNNSALLTYIAGQGCNPGNTIIKNFGPSTSSWAAAGRAAGYKTWGYFYDTDVPTNLATYQSQWDLLGLQFDSTSAHWTTALSYGKPIIAHTIATAANKTLAVSNGAAGLMVSGVTVVVPQASNTAAMTSGSSLAAAASRTTPAAAGMTSGSVLSGSVAGSAAGAAGMVSGSVLSAIVKLSALAGAGMVSASVLGAQAGATPAMFRLEAGGAVTALYPQRM